MKHIYDKLNEETLRMGKVILLAGALHDGEAVSDSLREFLEDERDEVLLRCFPGLPSEVLEDRGDLESVAAGVTYWAVSRGKLGFLIEFERPVMTFSASGNASRYSWGHYGTYWVYGDTLDDAVRAGLEWAASREASEKARAAKSQKGV